MLVRKHSVSTYYHSFGLLLLTHLFATLLAYRTVMLQLFYMCAIHCVFLIDEGILQTFRNTIQEKYLDLMRGIQNYHNHHLHHQPPVRP